MKSIRRSLIIGTIAVSAVSILVAGVFLYRIVRAQLYQQFDAALESRANTLASTLEIVEGRLEIDFEDLDMREFEVDCKKPVMQSIPLETARPHCNTLTRIRLT